MSIIYKCKMCGGSLEIKEGESIAVCEYCGTKQTLPKLDSEKKSNLLDRADHFRRNNEYDKAMSIYEQVLADEKDDAEIYWLIVLCRYGIEYVEDPSTHKRIPTVNRVQYNSILNDDDYLKALDLADSYQKDIYIEEAKRINEIQAGILEVSNKEEPFDIFICYKETDDNGRRTEDSVIAQDIYKELTSEGYKVFFSRITLEDKIGTAYEPYIFAALNSAKIMLSIGTKSEYFDAVWVKNEWSRYLSLIKQGQKKTLIPCYKNMDAYDLPEEFAYLQAQDLNKLGYMQDLIRGIEKIIKPINSINALNIKYNNNKEIVSSLIKRMLNFVDEQNWEKADEYSEKILDIDPDNGYAYLGKLLIELKATSFLNAINDNAIYQYSINYRKMMKNADIELKNKIDKAIEIENNRKNEVKYNRAQCLIKNAKNIEDYEKIILEIESIANYKDSKRIIEDCKEKIKQLKNKEIENIYNKAILLFERDPKKSLELLNSIKEHKDSSRKIEDLIKIIQKIDKEEKAIKVKRNRKIVCVLVLIIICVIGERFYNIVIAPNRMYHEALSLLEQEKYDEAYTIFRKINLRSEINKNKYDRAIEYMNDKDYLSAYNLLYSISYKDAWELTDECLLNICINYLEKEDYVNAFIECNKLRRNEDREIIIDGVADYFYELIENGGSEEVINLIGESDILMYSSKLCEIYSDALKEFRK